MENLERYTRTNGTEETLYRCRECGHGNQGGFDNGFVPTLPYPHTPNCPTRE